MPTPREATSLGGMTLKNRFVRSATWEGLAADDGFCTPELVNVIADLARGEIGLIISSHAYVSLEGQAGPRQIAICDDRFVAGLAKMVEAAHDQGSRIILQLAHAGIHATTSEVARISDQQRVGGRTCVTSPTAARKHCRSPNPCRRQPSGSRLRYCGRRSGHVAARTGLPSIGRFP